MTASKALQQIISIITLGSVSFALSYFLFKINQILSHQHQTQYQQLKIKYYYKYIIKYDVLYTIFKTCQGLLLMTFTLFITIRSIALINQLNIKDFSEKTNQSFVQNLDITIVIFLGILTVILFKKTMIYSIVTVHVIYRWYIQVKFKTRSDVQFYKKVYDLEYLYVTYINHKSNIKSIKTIRSDMIDDLNQIIDQLIDENQSVKLNNKTIQNITLISFRVGNHSLLNTLELAFINLNHQFVNHRSLNMDKFTKLFKLDGFAEHQKSKKLQYTPVQAVII